MAKYQTWELTPNEIIEGLMVTAAGAVVSYTAGRARIDGRVVEVAAGTVTNTVTGATPVDLTLYINPDKDYDGNVLARISFTKEPDHSHTNINGTVGTRYSRSLPIATMKTATTTANIDTTTINNNAKDLYASFTNTRSEMGN
jgi:hypothetical protein